MIFKVMLMARMLALMKVYHENSLLLKNFEDLKTSVTLNGAPNKSLEMSKFSNCRETFH